MSNPKKHIYLVRHGRSHANETGIREGAESPLTEDGEKQADFVAARFRSIPIDVVLTSHYVRAYDTGKKIADASNVPLETVSMAYERELPLEVQGKHRDDPAVRQAVAQFEYSWMRDANTDNGEHFDDIKKRVVELTELLEARPEEHIVVTSHGFFLKFFIAHHLLGEYLTPDIFVNQLMHTMRSANTGITYFTLGGKKDWSLCSWNDYAHLGEIVRERWYS
ncbi:histidine phosphatase family protein [Candidatus Kaiserbacteria bacterium]|nr:MAG: histidine phosphatase family protein [Candidatus Kaiserbacteria bacterium]